jgi:hypothetical protein
MGFTLVLPLSGLGATILTYVGLTRFEPVRIPE